MFVGVDSHKDTLAACVVDEAGREIAAATFENSPTGHAKLLRWAQRSGEIQRVGVECSGTYGRAFAKLVVEQGVPAFEVPTRLSVRERRHLRRPGKSDPGDALAIARVTARETMLPPLGRPQLADDLAVLMDFRDELVLVAGYDDAGRVRAPPPANDGSVSPRIRLHRSQGTPESLCNPGRFTVVKAESVVSSASTACAGHGSKAMRGRRSGPDTGSSPTTCG